MRANSKLPVPSFITKFLHVDLALARNFRCQASLLPANFAEGYANLLSATRQQCDVLIIDRLVSENCTGLRRA